MSAPGNEPVAEAAAEAVAESAAPAPVAAETAPANPGPWAADLTEYFGENAEAIAAADRYMREKIQPRMTTLETEAKPALDLWQDFNSQPKETLLDIIEELYGEEQATAFEQLVGGEVAETPVEDIPDAAALPPEVQKLVDKAKADEDAENYQAFTDGLKADHGLDDDDIALIHPFIHAAGGDGEKAVAGYRDYEAKFKAKHGVTPAEAAEETTTPPATLGADGTAATTPPGAEKQYTSWDQLDDAFDDFQAENAKGAPTPVGTV